MYKKGLLGLIFLFAASLCLQILTFAETIILKSGQKVEGKITEKTDKYIKIDFQGTPLTYFFDEIESIDGKNIGYYLKEKETPIQDGHSNYKKGIEFISEDNSQEEAKEPTPGCVAIYGDNHRFDIVHEQIVTAIIKTKPKVVFHVGDFVDNGSDHKEWVDSKKIIAELTKVSEFFLVVGNHDESPLVTEYFNFPNNSHWYSVERNNIHFTVLDSNLSLNADSPQYKWLESDLNSIGDKIKFRIVLFHHPIFSTGYHGGSKRLKDILVPLFEKYHVDIVFSGHDHNYERSQYHNIYYIVTGGGGESLYGQKEKESPYSQFFIKENHFCQVCVVGNKLVVSALDMYLNVLDEFSVDKIEIPVAP